jgi:putative oxidoreductase
VRCGNSKSAQRVYIRPPDPAAETNGVFMASAYSHSQVTVPASYEVRAAAGVNDALLAIGRVMIAVMFVMSGLEKAMDLGATASAIGSKGLPAPFILAILTTVLELGGGLLIIVGWQTRIIALALALFTAVAAYFFHDFWHYPPGAEHTNNMIHFMKNLSVIGGFLMLCAAGAGRYSLDGPGIRPEYLR